MPSQLTAHSTTKNPDGTSIQRKINSCASGGLGCNSNIYIKKKKGTPPNWGDEIKNLKKETHFV